MTTTQHPKARATAGFTPSPFEPLPHQLLPTLAQHRIATSDVWVPLADGEARPRTELCDRDRFQGPVSQPSICSQTCLIFAHANQ